MEEYLICRKADRTVAGSSYTTCCECGIKLIVAPSGLDLISKRVKPICWDCAETQLSEGGSVTMPPTYKQMLEIKVNLEKS